MLNVQIFSSKPLDRDLRLPEDPYELDAQTLGVMSALGVVFWRDEEHGWGVRPDETIDGLKEAYYHQVIMNEEIWVIDKWSKHQMARSTKTFEDSNAWVIHNKKVTVESMDSMSVRYRERD